MNEPTKQRGFPKGYKRGPMAPEHKAKISAAHKATAKAGRHWNSSPEARAKLSRSHMGLPSGRTGHKLNEEQRKQLSEAHKGIKLSEESKKRLSVSIRRAYQEGRMNQKPRSGPLHPLWKGGISKKPGYKTPYGIAYKARKLGAKGSFTPTEWFALKERCQFMCLCCKEQEPTITLAADHIIPLSRGGNNDIFNIQPLCQSCNSRKYTKAIDFMRKVSYLQY